MTTPFKGVRVIVVAVVKLQVLPGSALNAPPDKVRVIVPAQAMSVEFTLFSTVTEGSVVKADPDPPATGWAVKTRWKLELFTENGLLTAGVNDPSEAVISKLDPPVPIVQPENVTTPKISLPVQPARTPVPCVSVKMIGDKSVVTVLGLPPAVNTSTIGWVVNGLPA